MALLPAGGEPITGELQALDGSRVELASLRGHPAVLYFFENWCSDCRAGLPHLEAVIARHAREGLQGWAVSMDVDRAAPAPYVAKLGLKLPVRWDENGKLAAKLGVPDVRSLAVLDASGALRRKTWRVCTMTGLIVVRRASTPRSSTAPGLQRRDGNR